MVTKQLIAETCLFGMGFDALGGCYLAYDLFGRSPGPFRAIARTAGYMGLFFFGYSLVLGLANGLVASIGMGVLLAIEYQIAGNPDPAKRPHKLVVVSFGMMRGIVLGIACTTVLDWRFGAYFGLFSGLLLSISYAFGFAPTHDYVALSKPSVNAHKLLASLFRTVGVGIAGIAAGVLTRGAHSSALSLGLRFGLAAGVVSAIVGLLSPWIEWNIDRLQDRRLGLFGLGLILVGMVLQSAQYWVVVFNLRVGS